MTCRRISRSVIGGLAIASAIALAAAERPASGGAEAGASASATSREIQPPFVVPRAKPAVPAEARSRSSASAKARARTAEARSSASSSSSSSSRTSSSGKVECEVEIETTVVENGVRRTIREHRTHEGKSGETGCSAGAHLSTGKNATDRGNN